MKRKQIDASVTAILRELRTTYNNLEIERDDSEGSEDGGEGDKGDEHE